MSLLKISYRTKPNFQQIISGHNRKISQNTVKLQPKLFSCPKGTTFPIEAKYISKIFIYHATESTSENKQFIEQYMGLLAPHLRKVQGIIWNPSKTKKVQHKDNSTHI